jgi:hypothetical protein
MFFYNMKIKNTLRYEMQSAIAHRLYYIFINAVQYSPRCRNIQTFSFNWKIAIYFVYFVVIWIIIERKSFKHEHMQECIHTKEVTILYFARKVTKELCPI